MDAAHRVGQRARRKTDGWTWGTDVWTWGDRRVDVEGRAAQERGLGGGVQVVVMATGLVLMGGNRTTLADLIKTGR